MLHALPRLSRILTVASFGFMAALGALPDPAQATQTTEQAIWVDAVGFASIRKGVNSDAARREAYAEALVSAALSGGATLKGHTSMDKGRITADFSIMRPTGQVLRHKITEQKQSDGTWRVTVRALVGAADTGMCAGHRRLDVVAFAPDINVSPYAPAWTAPLANDLFVKLLKEIDRHKSAILTQATGRNAATFRPARESQYDYAALTRGGVSKTGGEHAFVPSITVAAEPGDKVSMYMRLAFSDGTGAVTARTFERLVDLPNGGSDGWSISNRTRAKAADELFQGLPEAMRTMLDQMTCMPPVGMATMAGGKLSVPLGRKHGLTKAHLAFVDDPNDDFGVLEITGLSNGSVSLRPLDPSRSLSSFAGLRMHFLDAGL